MTISEAELAQMNATLDDLKMRGWPGIGLSLGDQRRLIRDVSRLNIELIRERERSEELRAALRECADALDAYGMDTGIVAKARAALGRGER